MRIRVKHTQKGTRRKKGNENENRFLEEMIGQEEEEEEGGGEEEEGGRRRHARREGR